MTDYTSGSSYPTSRIAGNVNQGGVELACILSEGTITVTNTGFSPDGYKDKVATASAFIKKDQWVTLDVDTGNTFVATYGLPVVKAITNGTLIVGKVVSEPRWQKVPRTTQDTWATMLAGKYFRVATVWFPGITGVEKAVVVGANTANIVPGVPATMQVDASATTALSTADGVVTLSAADASSGGLGVISFHYIAAGSNTQYALLGFTGGAVVVQA